MIKTVQKLSTERTYLNIIQAIYDKLTVNIILNGEKLKNISIKIRNKTKMPILTTFIQQSIGRKRNEAPKLKRKKQNCHCLHMTWYNSWKILKTPPKTNRTHQ